MPTDNYALDATTRLGEIPFVEFTVNLVTEIFDSLVASHILQMHEYATFVQSMTQSLGDYVNNTVDNVSFTDISAFISAYQLPPFDSTALTAALGKLQTPPTTSPTSPSITPPTGTVPTPEDKADATWWGSLINTLGPVVGKLVDKIPSPANPDLEATLDAWKDYNTAALGGITKAAAAVPTYKQISGAIAALIASNKYSLLSTMVEKGLMQLVVTRGVIETGLNFSAWTNENSGSSSYSSTTSKEKSASNVFKGGGLLGLLGAKKSFTRDVHKVVKVETASAYQNQSSGTNINIYGRLRLEFETRIFTQ